MKVHFFERKYVAPSVSIEKLFTVIKLELNALGVETVTFKNPYALKKMAQSLWYFNKNQGEINHITGDIHWVALALNPKRSVLTIHDLAGLQYLKGIRKKIYFYLWIYWPIKKLKYITVISEKTKNEIIELLPWAADKLMVIPNCLTMEVPQNFKKEKSALTKFLIVGTRSNKNIEHAIQALKKIQGELTIVGEVSDYQKRLLEEIKIKHIVYSTVEESVLFQLYKEADILLFPSFYEGFGLPILEAQAYQCAVITSDLSPMKEVAGENGAVLVNPNSIDEIHQAIVKILENDSFRSELVENGWQNVKKYQPKRVALQYLNLYQKIRQENDSN